MGTAPPLHTMAGRNSNSDDSSRVPNGAFPRESLPKELQKIVDRHSQDDWMDDLYEGATPDTTDTSMRYAAYANRLRTIMLSAHRYVAYTSDIGESFRPVAHPWLVRGAAAVNAATGAYSCHRGLPECHGAESGVPESCVNGPACVHDSQYRQVLGEGYEERPECQSKDMGPNWARFSSRSSTSVFVRQAC